MTEPEKRKEEKDQKDYFLGYQDGSQDRLDQALPPYLPPRTSWMVRQDLVYWQGQHDGFNGDDHQLTGKTWAEMNKEWGIDV